MPVTDQSPAREQPDPTLSHFYGLELVMTQELIADTLGLRREGATRALSSCSVPGRK